MNKADHAHIYSGKICGGTAKVDIKGLVNYLIDVLITINQMIKLMC